MFDKCAFKTLPLTASDYLIVHCSLNYLSLQCILKHLKNPTLFSFVRTQLQPHVAHSLVIYPVEKNQYNSLSLLLEWFLEVLIIDSAKWEVKT